MPLTKGTTNPVSSALLGGALVAMAIQANKPAPTPAPPPCEINAKALDAIKDQNKQLFDSNKDLRDAIAKLPEDKQKFIDDQVKAQAKTLELEDKIAEAEKAKREAERAEQAAKDKPCVTPAKPAKHIKPPVENGINIDVSNQKPPLWQMPPQAILPSLAPFGYPGKLHNGTITNPTRPPHPAVPVPKSVWLFGSGVAVVAVLKTFKA